MKTIREIFQPSGRIENEVVAELEAREKEQYAEIAEAVNALEDYMNQIEEALADDNPSQAMVVMMLANDVMVWLKARVRSEGQS